MKKVVVEGKHEMFCVSLFKNKAGSAFVACTI